MIYSGTRANFPTVSAALEAMNVYDLQALAILLPGSEELTQKADLIALILTVLHGEPLRKLWDQMDDLQQAAVAEAVHGPSPAYNERRFVARYGNTPDWGFWNGWPKTASPLRLIFYYGVIPADLRARLAAFVPPPTPFVLKVLAEAPLTQPAMETYYDAATQKYLKRAVEIPIRQHRMERAAQHDLFAVLRLTGAGKVAVSDKTRFPTGGTIKAVTAILQGGDYYETPETEAGDPDSADVSEAGPIKGFAWPMILQAARLAELSGKRLELTDAGRKALAAPPSKTLRAVWQAWLKTDLLDELRRINAIKGQTGKGKRDLTKPATRRAKIVQALKSCPVGLWFSTTDFIRHLRVAELDFEVTRNLSTLALFDASYNGLAYESDTWAVLQERYLLCFLLEYAATLGLIDVATIPPNGARSDYRPNWSGDHPGFLSRYDGLLYLRLTALGAYCLGIALDYIPAAPEYTAVTQEARPILKVLPNFDIVVMEANLSAGDAGLLATYAEQSAPSVWRLNAARLLDAIETGHPLQVLQAFLEARNGGELPGTVLRLLSDYDARSGRLQDRGMARLVECSDDMLAALIANDTQAKKYCFLAGARYLVVPIEHEVAFRRAVKHLGFVLPQ